MDKLPEKDRWPVWQADTKLAIRGMSIVMSEQQAAHWCPIQINEELARHVDTPDTPVPLVSTFLLDPAHEAVLRRERNEPDRPPRHGGRLRYVLSMRVFKLVEKHGAFRFTEHLEQVPDWADSLIVDVGPNDAADGLQSWMAWNSEVAGPNDELDPITKGLPPDEQGATAFRATNGVYRCRVDLPPIAKALPVLSQGGHLTMTVRDRGAASHLRP
jgi:hypothetical protein